LRLFINFLSLKTDESVSSKSNKQTKKLRKKHVVFIFWTSWQPLTKKAGSGFRAGSLCQWYGFADPDPHQNVTDPQHYRSYRNRLLVYLKARNGAGDGSSPFRIVRIHVGLELRLHKPCIVIIFNKFSIRMPERISQDLKSDPDLSFFIQVLP
jgi:hypothetical protein